MSPLPFGQFKLVFFELAVLVESGLYTLSRMNNIYGVVVDD